MISFGMIALILVLYVATLFLVAMWGETRSPLARKLTDHPLVFSLSITVYCTSWTYYGSVGQAATTGFSYLAVYLGPTLVMILWWMLLKKMILIRNRYRITSIADFISTRYGCSQTVAGLATLIAVVGIVPYMSLQLKAVITSIQLLSSGGSGAATSAATGATLSGNQLALLTVGLLILFTIFLGVRKLDPTERHPGIILALAAECVFKLLAFLVAGAFICFSLFDGFDEILTSALSVADTRQQLATILDPPAAVNWGSLLILSMAAFMFLPRQFHVMVVENQYPQHVHTAQWLVPLYLILINLFVLPIAIAGLVSGYDASQADSFVILLPLDAGQTGLSLLIFLGGFSSAMGMIMISSMAIAIMVTNHMILPMLDMFPRFNQLRLYLLQCRWLVVASILLVSYGFYVNIASSYMLVNIGLISFVAVLQFAPVMIGAMCWPQASRIGAIGALFVGFVLWFYTLVLPAAIHSGWLPQTLITQGPWDLLWLRPQQLLGITLDPLSHSVFWTLLGNTIALIGGSLVFPATDNEDQQAERFYQVLAENPTTEFNQPQERNIELNAKVKQLSGLLGQYLVDHKCLQVIEQCLTTVGLHQQSHCSLAELAKLEREAEYALSGSIGGAMAHKAISQAALFNQQEKHQLSSLYNTLLGQLKITPDQLQEKINYFQEREQLFNQHATQQSRTIEQLQQEATQREQAERELSASQEVLSSIMDNSISVIFVKNLLGEYTLVNQQFKTLFHLTEKETVGKTDFAIYPSELAELYVRNDQAVLESDNPMTFEEPVLCGSETLTYITVKFPLHDPEGQVNAICGIATDITERKRWEEQLKSFNEELEKQVQERTLALESSNHRLTETLDQLKNTQSMLVENEKMAALGSLVAGVAHEINTPLGIAVTAASVLEQEIEYLLTAYDNNQLKRSELEHFRQAATTGEKMLRGNLQRAAELISKFKLVAVDQSSEQFRRFNLKQHIADILLSMAPYTKKYPHQITVDCPDDLVINSDPSAFFQIITNLVTNSYQHGLDPEQPGTVRLLVEKTTSNLTFTFSDNGRGISQELIDTFANPFVTTDRASGCSGLGTHIIHNLVSQKLAGQLTTRTGPDQGLTYVIELPFDNQMTIGIPP